MRRSLLLVGILLVAADTAAAQIIRQPAARTRPWAWTSAGVGHVRQDAFCDPDSNSCWTFRAAPQYRFTLEMPVGRDTRLGIAATVADMPLIYSSQSPSASCTACEARAQMTQYLGFLQLGGSTRGIHQIVELGAGVTVFRHFKSTTGTSLNPSKAVTDFTFALAPGLGYGFTSRLSLYVAYEFGVVVHKRTPGSVRNSAQQNTTRVGLRLGITE